MGVTVYRDPLSEGFSHFVTLHDCSGCFRLERLPGGPCTHWKAPPFHGARQKRTLPAAVRMFGWGRERSSHFESVLLGAPHVPERAGCDADNGMRMMVATRAKR